jgi:hypothetical protein
MAAVYRSYFEMLKEEGVTLIAQFTSVSPYSRYGSWGLKIASDQSPAEVPKYRGFMAFLESQQ